MNDDTYAQDKARIIAAREEQQQIEGFRGDTLLEAEARGEAFVLEYWYLRDHYRKPFFTLEEALELANGDCSPDRIVAPNGDILDPTTGEKREVQR